MPRIGHYELLEPIGQGGMGAVWRARDPASTDRTSPGRRTRMLACAGWQGSMTRLLLACLRFYRRRLSPLLQSSCRFTPTCSRYAIEALERYGWRRGGHLAVLRVLRCRPGAPGGFDPVP